ncbi:MAG: FAD-dependent oxidoreductase [Thermoplasmata archaeon]|nr:FAD-dependent oxidoreductase [Thermoplasmata archaeon]
MGEEIIVVGCGASGGTAAQFARKTSRNANVTVFEKSKYPQYSKCALPYLISGKISGPEKLIEFSVEWFNRAKIKLFLNSTVTGIDDKKVYVKKNSEVIVKEYDKLVIATGARSAVPPIKNILDRNGELKKGVFTLRTVDDAIKIINYIGDRKRNALIVGGGLIGLEVAEAFYSRKLNVTVVEMLPNILPSMIDEDMSRELYDQLSGYIDIFTNHMVLDVEGDDKVESVRVKNNGNGEEFKLPVDVLVVSTGIKPDVDLARSIGCKIGEKGGIVVNRRCETSVENVYAVGDCTEGRDFVTGGSFLVGLGSIGVRQGIVAGVNAAGGDMELFDGFLQTRTTRLFDVEIAAVGPVSAVLDDDVVSGKFRGSTHPEYYPGGSQVVVKVLCNKFDKRIVGAQVIGKNAAQRINTMACALLHKMGVDDFIKLETAYAPPIAPTIDPLAAACEVANMKLRRRN